jgi:hypothetical protein
MGGMAAKVKRTPQLIYVNTQAGFQADIEGDAPQIFIGSPGGWTFFWRGRPSSKSVDRKKHRWLGKIFKFARERSVSVIHKILWPLARHYFAPLAHKLFSPVKGVIKLLSGQ